MRHKFHSRLTAALLATLGVALALIAPSAAAGSGAFFQHASADGSKVFFQTDEQLVLGDIDASFDVYQRSGGVTTLVSQGAINGNGANNASFDGASADGSKVFFKTREQLTAGDIDTNFDTYQRSGGVTTLVSTDTSGNANGPDTAFYGGASSDGTKVFFETDEQLATSDLDSGATDVYQHSGGATTQVSTNTAGNANGAGNDATFRGASSDGSKVFFETDEQLGGTDADSNTDVYERSAGATTQVSTNTVGAANGANNASFRGASTDGAKVFFETDEQLAATDGDSSTDVYERSGGATTQVSTNTAGTANGVNNAQFRGASSDGLKVFFTTVEQLGGDTDGTTDVYQRSGGVTTLVSQGAASGGPASFDGTSSDGSRVFFDTDEQLVAGDTDSSVDLYERSSGVTTQVSQGAINGNGALSATFEGASSDGTKVFFQTDEQLVTGDIDSTTDVYERSGGVTRLVTAEGIPPDTTTAGPSGVTTDPTPTFSFSSNEAGSTFECRVDGTSFAPCSSPFTAGLLADGPHAFHVRATDIAANSDPTPATRSFKVDTTPPDTSIT
ncbi:MAG: large repetitive protein, partial [Thermoleophilaceae bacterium]|nr:large repetitive protein [Thermoleophilaceae bacterium]